LTAPDNLLFLHLLDDDLNFTKLFEQSDHQRRKKMFSAQFFLLRQ